MSFICAHTIWIEGPLLGLIPFHSNRSWRNTHTYEIEESIDINKKGRLLRGDECSSLCTYELCVHVSEQTVVQESAG